MFVQYQYIKRYKVYQLGLKRQDPCSGSVTGQRTYRMPICHELTLLLARNEGTEVYTYIISLAQWSVYFS